MRTLFWHRRDLRIEDNAGLYQALKSSTEVIPVFLFDQTILSKLPSNDQRVLFIHQQITALKKEYQSIGSDLVVEVGNPIDLIPELCKKFGINQVVTNRDYEPYAQIRDRRLLEILTDRNIPFKGFKDHVIFEKNEIVKADGKPYTVFTPYANKWRSTLTSFHLKSYPTLDYVNNLFEHQTKLDLPSMEEIGFQSKQTVDFPNTKTPNNILINYHQTRDIPSTIGTSRLSLHLRFGTISIRQLAEAAKSLNATYLNELIWRDFYQMIIFHFPHAASNSFKSQYDQIQWEHNVVHFEAWCQGKTGYPLVDAGMRELNTTGYMHNRVRMVVASFLTKHLLLDWRLGEAYFAEKLLDFELASNNGGWQWASGSGCDAAPYFRVFNPTAQQQKFDPKFLYIKKWIPEYGTSDYPDPIIEHTFARNRAISRYKEALTDRK